jgi:transcriptional regulator with XRE-family HTH domain
MKERIIERLNALSISQSDLAERLGVSRQNVNAWIKGRSSPRSKELLSRLSEVLQCSVGYLLYGEKSDIDPDADTAYISIPVFDVKASCGRGIENFDSQMVRLIKVALPWLRAHIRTGSINHLNVITASGDSMQPTIHDGDLILIDTSEKPIHSDRVYCLVVDGELYLKRVQRIPGGLRLLSDNNRYPPVDIVGEFSNALIVCGAARCILEAKAM